MQLQLQFIIHFLPVSSGFHMDTRAFLSLLRVFYARHLQYERAIVVCYITDIKLSRMTLGASVVC
jgi:hypothetical protein